MRARLALAAMVIAAGAAPSCKAKEVSFTLDVPNAVAGNVSWFEIGAYPNGSCLGGSELAGGVPLDGMSAYVTFSAADASPPTVGSLRRGSYAFAAVARQSDCGVIATGCANVDVAHSSEVTIQLAPTASALGACEAGTVCDDARCVDGADNGDPSIGAGCALTLTGAGPLADPLTQSSTLLSAPVVAATGDGGFMIAYREIDPASANARLTTLPLDQNGGAGASTAYTLMSCAGATTADPTGFTFGPSGGLVALSRPQCGSPSSKVGIDFLALSSAGVVGQAGFRVLPGNSVSLAPARALAGNSRGALLAMTIDGQTYDAPVAGVDLASAPTAFGDTPPQSAGWVAIDDQGTALLAVGAASEGDAGDAADPGGSTLRLSMVPSGGSLTPPLAAVDFPGSWGSVGIVGTRVLVVGNGNTSGQPVDWYAYDVGSTTPAAQGGFALGVLGEPVYADVALEQDHAFVAVEVTGMAGTISLVALDHVSTTPVYLREFPFNSDPRIPIGAIRDGLVSVAATNSRVAVVWGTGKTLGSNDGVGGYAVFACTP